MKRQGGGGLTAQTRQAEVLYDEGVYPGIAGLPDGLQRLRQLGLTEQGVHGQMHRNAAGVAVGDDIGKRQGAEILGSLSCMKRAVAEIDGIRPAAHGGLQHFRRADGR